MSARACASRRACCHMRIRSSLGCRRAAGIQRNWLASCGAAAASAAVLSMRLLLAPAEAIAGAGPGLAILGNSALRLPACGVLIGGLPALALRRAVQLRRLNLRPARADGHREAPQVGPTLRHAATAFDIRTDHSTTQGPACVSLVSMHRFKTTRRGLLHGQAFQRRVQCKAAHDAAGQQ